MNYTSFDENFSKKLTPSFIDFAICGLTLCSSVAISLYFEYFNKKASVAKYLTGGGKINYFPIAASVVASEVSSISLLGLPADVYRYGCTYLLSSFAMVLVCLALIFIYLPVFYHLKLTSIYEYIDMRFDGKTRLLVSFLYLMESSLVMPLTIYVPSLAVSSMFGVDVRITVPIVCSACIIYTTLGGLKSVIWIDVLQLLLIVATMLVILVLGMQLVGGPAAVWSKAKESGRLNIFDFDIDPTKRDSFWITVLGTATMWLSESCNQHIAAKFSAVPTFRQCTIAVILFGFGLVSIKVVCVINGLILYAQYWDCDPLTTGGVTKMDALMPYFVTDILKDIPGLSGLFIAGIFSASLSTFSTQLSSMAGVIYKNYLLDFLPTTLSEKTNLKIIKAIVVIHGTLLTLLVFLFARLGGLFQLCLCFISLCGGPILGIFSMGILIPRANSTGAFYGGITGLLTVSVLLILSKYYEVTNNFIQGIKPVSIEGCTVNGTFVNSTYTNSSYDASVPQPNFLLRISFYYYCLIGSAITMIVGTGLSCVTKPKLVNKALITPLCRGLVEEKLNANDYQQVASSDIKQSQL